MAAKVGTKRKDYPKLADDRDRRGAVKPGGRYHLEEDVYEFQSSQVEPQQPIKFSRLSCSRPEGDFCRPQNVTNLVSTDNQKVSESKHKRRRRHTSYSEEQLSFLEVQWTRGMNSTGRECVKLVEEAAAATGLSVSSVKKWIQNHRKAVSEFLWTMTTKRPRSPALPKTADPRVMKQKKEKPKIQIVKELPPAPIIPNVEVPHPKTECSATKITPQEKVVNLLQRLAETCSSLATLGVDTACLTLNKQSAVYTMGSKLGVSFLKKKGLQSGFLNFIQTQSDRQNNRTEMMQKVKFLFDKRFAECTGTDEKLSYSRLEKNPLFLEIEGFPEGLVLKRPGSYGIMALKKILESADKIKFKLNQRPVVKNETINLENFIKSQVNSNFCLAPGAEIQKDVDGEHNITIHTTFNEGTSDDADMMAERDIFKVQVPEKVAPTSLLNRSPKKSPIRQSKFAEKLQKQDDVIGKKDVVETKVVENSQKESSNGVFAVEKIIRRRVVKGHALVLVKWKGYGKKFNSWEPEENVFTM